MPDWHNNIDAMFKYLFRHVLAANNEQKTTNDVEVRGFATSDIGSRSYESSQYSTVHVVHRQKKFAAAGGRRYLREDTSFKPTTSRMFKKCSRNKMFKQP